MRRDGLTLVELLISMAVFGVLMAAAFTTMTSTGLLTERQTQVARVEATARLAQQRMKEVIQQAHYIYPPGASLNLRGEYPTPSGMRPITEGSGQVKIGGNALAVLVPAGTTYCQDTTPTYCLFVYDVDQNNKFAELIGDNQSLTTFGLVEWQRGGLTWNQNTIPAQTPSLLNVNDMTVGLIVDSVSNPANLTTDFSASFGSSDFDSRAGFVFLSEDDTDEEREEKLKSANLVVNTVQPSFTIEYTKRGKTITKTFSDAYFASTIPRATPPIP